MPRYNGSNTFVYPGSEVLQTVLIGQQLVDQMSWGATSQLSPTAIAQLQAPRLNFKFVQQAVALLTW